MNIEIFVICWIVAGLILSMIISIIFPTNPYVYKVENDYIFTTEREINKNNKNFVYEKV